MAKQKKRLNDRCGGYPQILDFLTLLEYTFFIKTKKDPKGVGALGAFFILGKILYYLDNQKILLPILYIKRKQIFYLGIRFS